MTLIQYFQRESTKIMNNVGVDSSFIDFLNQLIYTTFQSLTLSPAHISIENEVFT